MVSSQCLLSVVSGQPKLQISGSKLQIHSKPLAPNVESTALAGVWSFEIGASLVFGFWSLEFSFVSQCLHRLHAGGTPRREVTGEKGDCSEERGNGGEGRRLSRTDSEEQTADPACHDEGAHETHRDAQADQLHPTADDEPEHIATLRAQCHPDADLLR